MSERNLNLVEPLPEQESAHEASVRVIGQAATYPYIKSYLEHRGRHDSGVQKLPAPEWQIFDPDAVPKEIPLIRGKHEIPTGRQRLEGLLEDLKSKAEPDDIA